MIDNWYINELKAHHKSYIKEIADGIRKKIRGGRLFGDPIDETDMDSMICAAYMIGKTESDRQHIHDIDVLTGRG
jgi:hypothetical protein